MGACKYCGKSAGFLREKHAECEEEYNRIQIVIESGRQKIIQKVLVFIGRNDSFYDLEKEILQIEKLFFVPSSERTSLLINGWECAVEKFLEDGVLDIVEEERLTDFQNHFNLSQNELDRNGALVKIVKAAVLRDILNGVLPQRISINENLSINLQKGEKIVWAFSNSKYLEDKIRRQYVGGSHGVSVRVMKGVYYKVGSFKGQNIEYMERVHIDRGWVILTNKNIYFVGSQKSLRISYAKVISFEPYTDGVGIMRDSANAKAQIFVTGDGWFTYNLVTNLSQL